MYEKFLSKKLSKHAPECFRARAGRSHRAIAVQWRQAPMGERERDGKNCSPNKGIPSVFHPFMQPLKTDLVTR